MQGGIFALAFSVVSDYVTGRVLSGNVTVSKESTSSPPHDPVFTRSFRPHFGALAEYMGGAHETCDAKFTTLFT